MNLPYKLFFYKILILFLIIQLNFQPRIICTEIAQSKTTSTCLCCLEDFNDDACPVEICEIIINDNSGALKKWLTENNINTITKTNNCLLHRTTQFLAISCIELLLQEGMIPLHKNRFDESALTEIERSIISFSYEIAKLKHPAYGYTESEKKRAFELTQEKEIYLVKARNIRNMFYKYLKANGLSDQTIIDLSELQSEDELFEKKLRYLNN